MPDRITPDRDSTQQAEPGALDHSAPSGESAAAPYLVTSMLALVVLVVLAAYLWLHRAEIVAILTQSPT